MPCGELKVAAVPKPSAKPADVPVDPPPAMMSAFKYVAGSTLVRTILQMLLLPESETKLRTGRGGKGMEGGGGGGSQGSRHYSQ